MWGGGWFGIIDCGYRMISTIINPPKTQELSPFFPQNSNPHFQLISCPVLFN